MLFFPQQNVSSSFMGVNRKKVTSMLQKNIGLSFATFYNLSLHEYTYVNKTETCGTNVW